MVKKLIFIFTFLFLNFSTVHAEVKGDEVTAKIVSIENQNENVHVKIKFLVKSGWHVYGEHPGDMGYPPKLVVSGVGNEVLSVVWPEGHPFSYGEYNCSGYSEDFDVSVSLKIKDIVSSPPQVLLSWLACDGVNCLPGKVTLQLPTIAV